PVPAPRSAHTPPLDTPLRMSATISPWSILLPPRYFSSPQIRSARLRSPQPAWYNGHMITTTSQPGWIAWVERGARWCLRHWLLCVNTLALLYAGLPWLSPLAKASGHTLIGELIFRAYTALCHQKPERSFFICGHQVAFCHRCTALYGGIV